MQSHINIKEVQKLTGHLVALSCFLSCADDKVFLFFAAIKNEMFEFSPECEKVFTKIKNLLTSPPIPTRQK